jgi:hypothetical protein
MIFLQIFPKFEKIALVPLTLFFEKNFCWILEVLTKNSAAGAQFFENGRFYVENAQKITIFDFKNGNF